MFPENPKFLRLNYFEKSKARDGRKDGWTDGRGATLKAAPYKDGRINI